MRPQQVYSVLQCSEYNSEFNNATHVMNKCLDNTPLVSWHTIEYRRTQPAFQFFVSFYNLCDIEEKTIANTETTFESNSKLLKWL